MTALRCLVVLAHPLGQSLAAHIAAAIRDEAHAAGWTVSFRDLYSDAFDPNLSQVERAAYYATPPDTLAAEKAELAAAQVLILVFPTWWSGFPAILKGWFDRVWAPGLAFDHAPDFGPMRPRLSKLKDVLAATTQGAPGWVDWLVLRRPLKRILRLGIIKPCAPQARVGWRAFYNAETADPARIARFEAAVRADIKAIARRNTCRD